MNQTVIDDYNTPFNQILVKRGSAGTTLDFKKPGTAEKDRGYFNQSEIGGATAPSENMAGMSIHKRNITAKSFSDAFNSSTGFR